MLIRSVESENSFKSNGTKNVSCRVKFEAYSNKNQNLKNITFYFNLSIHARARARVRRSSFAKSAFAKSSRKKTLDACMLASSSSSIIGLLGAYKQSEKSQLHLWEICSRGGGDEEVVCAYHNFRSFQDSYFWPPVISDC